MLIIILGLFNLVVLGIGHHFGYQDGVRHANRIWKNTGKEYVP